MPPESFHNRPCYRLGSIHSERHGTFVREKEWRVSASADIQPSGSTSLSDSIKEPTSLDSAVAPMNKILAARNETVWSFVPCFAIMLLENCVHTPIEGYGTGPTYHLPKWIQIWDTACHPLSRAITVQCSHFSSEIPDTACRHTTTTAQRS